MRDSDLSDGIAGDMEIFDNAFTGCVLHRDRDAIVDNVSGTISTKDVETIVEHCLFRDTSNRVMSSIKQVHERNASMQDDTFDNTDQVVEIPMVPGLLIAEGDVFIDMDTEGQPKFQINSVDRTTLTTRYRVGLRSFT